MLSMKFVKHKSRAMLSWLFLGTLLTLCAMLGVLQYRWIDEVSVAARERLRGSLQASLLRVSQEFNSEIFSAARAIAPSPSATDGQEVGTQLTSLYQQWERSSRHGRLFRRIGLVVPQDGIQLRVLDPARGLLEDSDWPPEWSNLKERFDFDVQSRLRPGQEPPGFRSREGGPPFFEEGNTFAQPVMLPPSERSRSGPFGPRDAGWIIFEVNPEYVRDVMLPYILQRHLGTGGILDYQVAVVNRSNPASVIYHSDPGDAQGLVKHADASVNLFEPNGELFRRWQPRGPGPGPGGGGGAGGPGFAYGRWQMFVRHRAGSLEALVVRARRRNLAVTMGVLLLMVATVGALVRYTQRAQRLAGAQMEFVAGVSHELRTPLTVIYTAGYNLQGKMAANPLQVAKYGALIQRESGRLRALVEQILRFGGTEAGRVMQEPEPVSVEEAIDEAIEASKGVVADARCTIEKCVDPGLPPVMGDGLALRHALENLVGNAAKYGSEGNSWIGISASKVQLKDKVEVEIRVADRGPGIPEGEQKHIFDPFFRGDRAVADQIHGTGLGLSLVKRIVEAHGGTIRVKSAPMNGAEFIMRIPAAPDGAPV